MAQCGSEKSSVIITPSVQGRKNGDKRTIDAQQNVRIVPSCDAVLSIRLSVFGSEITQAMGWGLGVGNVKWSVNVNGLVHGANPRRFLHISCLKTCGKKSLPVQWSTTFLESVLQESRRVHPFDSSPSHRDILWVY